MRADPARALIGHGDGRRDPGCRRFSPKRATRILPAQRMSSGLPRASAGRRRRMVSAGTLSNHFGHFGERDHPPATTGAGPPDPCRKEPAGDHVVTRSDGVQRAPCVIGYADKLPTMRSELRRSTRDLGSDALVRTRQPTMPTSRSYRWASARCRIERIRRLEESPTPERSSRSRSSRPR
jgi:hypothetical protein